mmetsp:Transcript_7609/g.19402  ORF Transcript_7609/g.19402 Transcript_7609/m.19402 type:complete len:509 (+) Transcript_7609:74-1600(+)
MMQDRFLPLALIIAGCSWITLGLPSSPASLAATCLDGEACDAGSGLGLLQKLASPSTAGQTAKLSRADAPLGTRAAEARKGALDISLTPCTPEDFASKDLDLIVYGATGYTGKLAAAYLAKGHPRHPRWAIAGRHEEELNELRETISSGPADRPTVLVADLQDENALRAMTSRAKVVLTFAGPYRKYGGENLISAAIATCTHYADITGEGPWKAEMLEKHGESAKARGVAIVQAVGLDSMPADILATRSAEMLASDGFGPPTDITVMWSKFNGLMSGGTKAAGEDSMLFGASIPDKAHTFALAPETPEEARLDSVPGGVPAHLEGPSLMGYDANFSQFTVPYFMGFLDGPTVRRSLALTFPGAPIHFSEVMGQSVMTEMAKFFTDPMMLLDPPNLDPAPGEGPPQWVLDKGGLAGQGLAVRGAPHAAEARLHLECHGDPGYAATSKWSVEFAVQLALEGPKDGAGGYLTPTLALGAETLVQLLSEANSGNLCSFWEGSAQKPEGQEGA